MISFRMSAGENQRFGPDVGKSLVGKSFNLRDDITGNHVRAKIIDVIVGKNGEYLEVSCAPEKVIHL